MRVTKRTIVITLSIVTTIGVFIYDLLTPLDRDIDLLYILPLIIASRELSRKYMYTFAVTLTVLIAVGYVYSPPGIRPPEITLFSRSLEVGIIWTVATFLSQRKRAEEELKRAKELSDALNSINAAINSTIDFDEIMRRVIVESMRAINAETSAILLLENNYWTLRYFYGKLREQEPELVGIKFTYEQAKAVALAARTAEPVILSDAYNDKRVNTELARKYQLRSIINIPLIARDEVIGSISFAYHSAPVEFKKSEIDFSRKLATSISLAVQNARLFEERKRVEEELERERDRAQNYLNIAGAMMVVINADQRVTLVNKKCTEVLGYSEQEIIGKNWFDTFIPERARDEVRAAFLKLIAGEIEPVEYFENPVLTREGTERLIAWHNAVLRDDAGNITSTLSSGEDITERRRAEEELRNRTEELARSNAELEQFAYIASHDLQEPLRMVSGFTQLLDKRYKGRLDKDADEFIAYIVDGTTRMQRMIEDLLAYSRVGTRGKPFEPTNLEDVFNQAITNLKTIIEENIAQITHDPLPTVKVDSTQMVQLFQNLIGNAIKFRKKEEPPHIHISAQRKGNEWVFSVKDNGIGIAPEFKGRLFKLFQREHVATEYPGTGIGLATCKRIVERHGGKIWAESEPGKGSTFYFMIPVRKGKG